MGDQVERQRKAEAAEVNRLKEEAKRLEAEKLSEKLPPSFGCRRASQTPCAPYQKSKSARHPSKLVRGRQGLPEKKFPEKAKLPNFARSAAWAIPFPSSRTAWTNGTQSKHPTNTKSKKGKCGTKPTSASIVASHPSSLTNPRSFSLSWQLSCS